MKSTITVENQQPPFLNPDDECWYQYIHYYNIYGDLTDMVLSEIVTGKVV